ncbi:hypothetical protein D9758_003070 [Tetrapyrgos nigripes]|uniref:RING-type domain-containing protein n=1 Tax=Tetrapyrgos nigripes TaxID=182062 RepID=A0A8H5GQE9_9AGAR|nr:hypothetical protein D9758_003070 [Tetrapyrgos nigripes]
MSLATWYTHQYSTWNRTRRLQVTPYLARTDTNTSRQARTMAQTPTIHNGLGNPAVGKDPKDKKGPDSLFGPNVGVISSGPSWTNQTEKKVLKDELTMDTVKGWIEKSKQPSQSTTTLQALVNLKRPTIRLSPLSSSSADGSDEQEHDRHSQQHGIEFEYDCDAPKCGIYVHVLLPPSHPDAPRTGGASPPTADLNSGADTSNVPDITINTNTTTTTPPSDTRPARLSKLLVFETVVDGGFGKILKLEEGAVLELGRFESSLKTKSTAPGGSDTNVARTGTPNGTDTPINNTANSRQPRRRLTHFFTRRHNHHNMSVSGPALAVVDASASDNTNGNGNGDANGASPSDKDKKSQEDKDKDGVKVTIRLAALDEQGTELASPNEQVTYLSVERFGPKPVKGVVVPPPSATPGAAAEGNAQEGEAEGSGAEAGANKAEEDEEEDTRPWVVKVVKREATIGPHTFHLHEIYGLTSSSPPTHTPAPTAPLPSTHTYPPPPPSAGLPGLPAPTEDHTAGAGAGAAEDPDAPSECLLCLSSPREVVLLPCRHLVACKDCALNMVEFGAGGNITQATEDSGNGNGGTGNGEAATGGTGASGATGTGTGADTATTVQNPRRKRKAKGWFCPVCRQPYTSLLRITTNPPPLAVGKVGDADADGDGDGDGSGHDDDEGDVEGDITDHPLAGAGSNAGTGASTANVNQGASGVGLPLPVTTNVPGATAAGAGANANANTGANSGAVAGAGGNEGEAAAAAASSSGGGLFTRPAFLRGLTGKNKNGGGGRDVESQA